MQASQKAKAARQTATCNSKSCASSILPVLAVHAGSHTRTRARAYKHNIYARAAITHTHTAARARTHSSLTNRRFLSFPHSRTDSVHRFTARRNDCDSDMSSCELKPPSLPALCLPSSILSSARFAPFAPSGGEGGVVGGWRLASHMLRYLQ